MYTTKQPKIGNRICREKSNEKRRTREQSLGVSSVRRLEHSILILVRLWENDRLERAALKKKNKKWVGVVRLDELGR